MSMNRKSRPWRGYGDVRSVQELAIEKRRLLGRRAPWHIGDVAWGLRQHAGREAEWRITIWEAGGEVVAWSWLRTDRASLGHDAHPNHLDLLDEILREPDARTAHALDDDEVTLAALDRHGYRERGEPMHMLSLLIDERPEASAVPDGFRLRTVEPKDLPERVAVHRDVWAPSRVTEESYTNVMAQWPYRSSLDCVVEADDGTFAAYCLAWPDDENGVGELEPVGVRDEFRRGGLGAAVCRFALARLFDEGLREAIVYCVTDPACHLYATLGFEHHTSVVGYNR
jgi:ribosomal protein S18 acetylase RimI-like enzyme